MSKASGYSSGFRMRAKLVVIVLVLERVFSNGAQIITSAGVLKFCLSPLDGDACKSGFG